MTGSYSSYPEQRGSDIEWVGAIPAHWLVKPAFAVVSEECIKNSGGVENNVLSLSYGGIKKRDVETNFGLLPESFNTYQIVEEGDIILRLTDLQNDKRSLRVGRSGQRGIITSAYLKLVCKPELDDRYAYRLLHSYDTTKVFYGMGGGLRQSMKFEDFRRLPLVVPPLEEQRTIAAFLDYETARIDALIAKQQRLIELLKEKRQAVISHAVTVREGEKSAKLSYFVDLLPGYAFPSSGFLTEAEGNVPLLRGVNVGVGNLKWGETVYWPTSDCKKLKAFELHEGDIVFGMDRPWISAGARVAEVTPDDLPCLLLQRVARIRSHKCTYQPFVKLCLSSHEFKSFIESDLTGVSVPHISPEQIKSFPVRAISYEQQKAETEVALLKCQELEVVEVKAREAIELMQERRTALISAAVTGKIDLREWTHPEEAQ
ncbi:restriction endonuclease subunit S [Ferrimonas sp. YFM]|uniref:restriction endonuclease subunit S n=1 Tax=Ferrimonas sp. YFM TaxID=3028878 RepID=UPI002572DCE5|nr:restriction endonuclease subunit S [Ferrimonas sp. YFM]BDY04688.1 restriction modification system DNA specificity domain-containing protein [Ferrimonas sp. YFM]